MTTSIPEGPFFIGPLKIETGGVDFLGLRQANLDLMDRCFPGINNYTRYVRGFSLISWIYWKFYEIAEAEGIEEPTRTEMERFKDKAEILFTWGHQSLNISGIPGITTHPPAGGEVELSFPAWSRVRENTSFMAAPIYGPASKNTGGLGFVSPVSGTFYRACANGVKLAQALDSLLKEKENYGLLTSFSDFRGTEGNAMNLLPAWDVRTPSGPEQEAFRESFYNEASVNSNSKIGRRSRSVSLIVHLLKAAETPLHEDALRMAMAYGRLKEKTSPALEGPLRSAWLQWLILQVRQAQRLAMEAIFSWIETRILMARERDTDTLVTSAMESLAKVKDICPETSSLGALLEAVVGDVSDINSLIDFAYADHSLCIFSLMEKLQQELKEDGFVIPYAMRVLMVCAKYVEVLCGDAEASAALKTGNFERISLQVMSDTMMTWAKRPLRGFLTYFIENMILSQHFGIAAMRFDGNRQRLRLAIEEDGLTALVSSPLQPFVGADRLSMALLLMADCGLISVDNNGMYSC